MRYLYVIGKHKEEVDGRLPEMGLRYVMSDAEMPAAMKTDLEEKGELVLQALELPGELEAGKELELKVIHSFLKSTDPDDLGGC